MNKDLKRRLYAIALAGVMFGGIKTVVNAESLDDVDMSYVDIDEAMSELIPDDPIVEVTKPVEETKPSETIPEETKPVNDNNSNVNNKNDVVNKDESVKEESKKDDVVTAPTESTTITDNSDDSLSDNVHTHRFNDVADDVINQVTPSCVVGGSYDEIYYCLDCDGAKIVHVDVAAPGHKWDDGEKVNITEQGYEIEYHCTNKGCTETRRDYYKTNEEPTVPTETTPKKDYPSDVPKTGDTFDIVLSAAMCGLSGLGLYGTGRLTSKIDAEDKKYNSKYVKSDDKKKGKYLSKRK